MTNPTSQIPYETTKNEILALLGPSPVVKMPRDSGAFAVHLVMERESGKTLDAFVELDSPGAAADLVARLGYQKHRVQQRHVRIMLSSQESLMKALFPKAKCVEWMGVNPIVMQPPDEYTSGFKFFVSDEELVRMVAHAQVPSRSPFATRTPQRTYEAMISLLFKVCLLQTHSHDYLLVACKNQH